MTTPVAPSPEVVRASLDAAVETYNSLSDLTRDGLDTIYKVMVGMTFGELAAVARDEICLVNAENLSYLHRQFEHLNTTLAISQEQATMIKELEDIQREMLHLQMEAQQASGAERKKIIATLLAVAKRIEPYQDRLIEMERRVQEDMMQMVALIGGMPS